MVRKAHHGFLRNEEMTYPSITSEYHPELVEGPLGGKDDLFI
jgi:hypothetical protein